MEAERHPHREVDACDGLAGEVPGGAVQGLIELREQGLIGAIGIAAGEIKLMTRYVTSGAFDVLLTHNRYTLIDRRAEELIAEAAAHGMGIFNAAPFGGGLLAGDGTRYAYCEASPELPAWVDRARELCHSWSIELPTTALHFSLRCPLIHSTVVGVSRPERIAQLEKLRLTTIPDDFWPALQALGTPPSTIDD
ncbi:aldo/keto reductase [Streptosporangium sp. NBC_01495]|nr:MULTISPECIES: aldo/keto reductase [unclassified Streptosporangium]